MLSADLEKVLNLFVQIRVEADDITLKAKLQTSHFLYSDKLSILNTFLIPQELLFWKCEEQFEKITNTFSHIDWIPLNCDCNDGLIADRNRDAPFSNLHWTQNLDEKTLYSTDWTFSNNIKNHFLIKKIIFCGRWWQKKSWF